MYLGMIETRSLKILLKSFHENYSDLFKKQHGNNNSDDSNNMPYLYILFYESSCGRVNLTYLV